MDPGCSRRSAVRYYAEAFAVTAAVEWLGWGVAPLVLEIDHLDDPYSAFGCPNYWLERVIPRQALREFLPGGVFNEALKRAHECFLGAADTVGEIDFDEDRDLSRAVLAALWVRMKALPADALLKDREFLAQADEACNQYDTALLWVPDDLYEAATCYIPGIDPRWRYSSKSPMETWAIDFHRAQWALVRATLAKSDFNLYSQLEKLRAEDGYK